MAKSSPEKVYAIGKRKRAVARATVRPGKGRVFLNAQPLAHLNNDLLRLKIQEPLILAGEDAEKYDYHIKIRGGGTNGQAEAAREAVGRALAQVLGAETQKKLLSYDWSLLVNDPRRTEPHKPPRSSQGPRRHKQRSKR